jgi:putative transposase
MDTSDDDRRGRHGVSALHVHVVFVTTYRRGVFDAAMLDACERTMRDVSAVLVAFTREDDHVHLLVEYPPKATVSSLVNSLTGISARMLRAAFTGRVNRRASMRSHVWSPSSVAASAGGAPWRWWPSTSKGSGDQPRRANPALKDGACPLRFGGHWRGLPTHPASAVQAGWRGLSRGAAAARTQRTDVQLLTPIGVPRQKTCQGAQERGRPTAASPS